MKNKENKTMRNNNRKEGQTNKTTRGKQNNKEIILTKRNEQKAEKRMKTTQGEIITNI